MPNVLIIQCLQKLYNAIITKDTIPMEWKRGLNVPVSKGGDKSINLSIAIPTWPEPLQCFFVVFEKITEDNFRLFK